MNDSAPSVRAQALRRVAIGVLGSGLAVLLLDVTLAAYLRHGYGTLDLNRHPELAIGGSVLALVICCLAPILILRALSRRGWLGWKHLAVLALFQGTSFGYLLADDAELRHPQSAEEFTPSLATDRETFQLTLRFARGGPKAQNLRLPQFSVGAGTAKITSDPAAWTSFLRQNRTQIEAGWQELQPVRAWWDEMAARPRLGDLTPSLLSATLIPFQPIRSYAQYACAIASLQALDGRGDEAMATLAGVYSVARKLEPTSRTLVRAMIARVVVGLVTETATYVLNTAPVSELGRRALSQELTATAGGAAGARRLVWMEYHFAQPQQFVAAIAVGDHAVTSGLGLVFASFSRLVVNPNRTLNLLGDRCEELAALAGEQKLEAIKAFEARGPSAEAGWLPIKNCAGYFLADLAQPAYTKIVEYYWKQESRRTALLQRLASDRQP
jgi:hypothetical protein